MTQKPSYKKYPKEFKEEAVALFTEQGYTVPKAAEALGVATNMLYRWRWLSLFMTWSTSMRVIVLRSPRFWKHWRMKRFVF